MAEARQAVRPGHDRAREVMLLGLEEQPRRALQLATVPTAAISTGLSRSISNTPPAAPVAAPTGASRIGCTSSTRPSSRRYASAPPWSRAPRIRVRGRLSEALLGAFPGLHAQADGAETVLAGELPDQAALYCSGRRETGIIGTATLGR